MRLELLELDDALRELAGRSPRQVRVVEYRFFAGMSVAETAEALGVSTRTVESDWSMARAWLMRALDHEPPRRQALENDARTAGLGADSHVVRRGAGLAARSSDRTI
jgi:hypothetical protein